MELLRPILELGVVIPGMLLAYFPAKSSLKQRKQWNKPQNKL